LDACVLKVVNVIDRFIAGDYTSAVRIEGLSWEVKTAQKYWVAANVEALQRGRAEAAAKLQPLLQQECINGPLADF
jgi:hypothetical protein